VDGEADPAAADVEHVLIGLEPQLPPDELALRALRLREIQLRAREVGTRVVEVLVEEGPEELTVEVVVVRDVAMVSPRASSGFRTIRARVRLPRMRRRVLGSPCPMCLVVPSGSSR
jgi:hypothetical protein